MQEWSKTLLGNKVKFYLGEQWTGWMTDSIETIKFYKLTGKYTKERTEKEFINFITNKVFTNGTKPLKTIYTNNTMGCKKKGKKK